MADERVIRVATAVRHHAIVADTCRPLREGIERTAIEFAAGVGAEVPGLGPVALDQPIQIERTAGFGPGAGFTFAAEWLHADDGADDIAIDVLIARVRAVSNGVDRFIDAALYTHREAVAGGIDRIDQCIQAIA